MADECTNALNFGASMTLIFVGPSRSDTSNLSRKVAFSMTITWNSWSDLFPIDVLLRGQQDTEIHRRFVEAMWRLMNPWICSRRRYSSAVQLRSSCSMSPFERQTATSSRCYNRGRTWRRAAWARGGVRTLAATAYAHHQK